MASIALASLAALAMRRRARHASGARRLGWHALSLMQWGIVVGLLGLRTSDEAEASPTPSQTL